MHPDEYPAGNRSDRDRRPLALIAATIVLVLAVGVGVASAGRTAEAVIGGAPGIAGGSMVGPEDVEVKQATGQLFVADKGNNRIQRFDSEGNFERAWGLGVVAPGGTGDGGGANQVQTILVSATGGTYALGFKPWGLEAEPGGQTGLIAYDASAADVEAALETLPDIEPGDVVVAEPDDGDPAVHTYTVEFTGRYAATMVNSIAPTSFPAGGGLTGGESTARIVSSPPELAFEICTVASECRPGVGGDLGGGVAAPEELAFDDAAGVLYVSDQSGRITAFDSDGNFLRLWGAGVIASGGAGDTPVNETQRVRKHPHPGLVPDGGSFALQFRPDRNAPAEVTGQIPVGATATEIATALEGLPSIEPGDVSASGSTGGPWTIEFAGAFADTALPLLESDDSQLTRGGVASNARMYAERKRAAGGHEICVVATDCRSGNLGGDAAGQIGELPAALAVGPDSHVFVADRINARVNEYESDGDFVRSWGWGVRLETPEFQICTAVSGCHRSLPTGESVTVPGQFQAGFAVTGGEMPTEIAVDAAGIVYASNSDHRPISPAGPRIERFDSTEATPGGLLLSPIRSQSAESPAPTGPLPVPSDGFPANLEIDPGTGNLYYQLLLGDVIEIDATDPVAVIDRHFAGFDQPVGGLAYHEGSDRLFASQPLTSDDRSRIVIAGATGSPPPIVVLAAPEVTSPSSVVFKGEVTPNGPLGIATSYRFEYRSSDEPTWARLPVESVKIGDGDDPVPVEQSVSGLEAAVDYEVRLVATKELGAGQTISPPKNFFLGTLPATVVTTYPMAHTDTEATLTGLVHPRNQSTTYYFEWGTDATYGNRAPVPDGVLPAPGGLRRVTARISGLSPQTTYHYRLSADNGVEEAPGDSLVEGEDVSFATRATSSPRPQRAYEMVTPPFKVVRAATAFGSGVGNNPNPGVPSLAGDTILWNVPFFPLTDEVGAPSNNDRRIIRRTAAGWVHETQNTLPMIGLTNFVQVSPIASSGDLETVALRAFSGVTAGQPESGGFLPTEGGYANRLYTFRKGTGVEGYNPWLSNPEKQVIDLEPDPALAAGGYSQNTFDDNALINDDGTAMVRWGLYGGLAEDPTTLEDDDPSDEQPLGGNMIYLQRASSPAGMPGALKDLVNECTGTGATTTQVPARTAAGRISVAACADGELTHRRGAVVGGGGQLLGGKVGQGPATTALADHGRRVFFQSPDPLTALNACGPGTGGDTDCPPQLFVRQYGSDGESTVRWISQSRSSAVAGGFSGNQIANQVIAQMGAGILFQGASRDGRFAYFQTNAPLVPTDPNGGTSILGGSASASSWDLYRYELPESLDADPAAGTLLRVSGGPSGSADPNTNPHSTGGSNGNSLRYFSDDGQRAYFVTGSPIPGADQTPPAGGVTTPQEANSQAAGTIRNLYLFDATKTGIDRYRFIARLPFATQGMSACATWGKEGGFGTERHARDDLRPTRGNCFRGTPNGQQVAFFTDGKLSGDDIDAHGDVYLYDAEADELARVTAPPPGVQAYVCDGPDALATPVSGEGCNGDFGPAPSAGLGGMPVPGGFAGLRHYNISENSDGTTSVYFNSRSQLVPGDTNGNYYDVYEWREGALRLVSPGNSADNSWFSGNSVSGRDAFFWTSARIDPREIDDADFDIYDARVDGGFPPPIVTRPCDVLALACEGEALPVPVAAHPQTGATGPSRNVKPRDRARCPKGKVRRKVNVNRRGKVSRKSRCVRKSGKKVPKKRGSRGADKRKGGAR